MCWSLWSRGNERLRGVSQLRFGIENADYDEANQKCLNSGVAFKFTQRYMEFRLKLDITAMMIATSNKAPKGWGHRNHPVVSIVTLNEETSRPIWSTLHGFRALRPQTRGNFVPPSLDHLVATGLLRINFDVDSHSANKQRIIGGKLAVTEEDLNVLSEKTFAGLDLRLIIFQGSSIRSSEVEKFRPFFREVLVASK